MSTVSPARDAALDILLKVEQGGFASELLHSERLDKLTVQDKGLATELVMGVLRWRSRLDEAIASVSSQKLAKLDAEVLESLRMAAYQIGFLERVPAHAAVNDAVELVKRKRKKSAAPFVNAVLRKLMKVQGIAPSPVESHVSQKMANVGHHHVNVGHQPDLNGAPASRYAHPAWMVERWVARYGAEEAERICEYDQQVPPTAIHLGDATVEEELKAEGIELAPGRLLRSARIVVNGDVTKAPAFRQGRVQIQDEGSQLVAMLVGRGERLLDCCAAPGGKTAIMAERNPRAQIVATELHEHRARAMQERLGHRRNVIVMAGDATRLEVAGEFDRVLADVPCSGTGTLARNPEIKWRLRTHISQQKGDVGHRGDDLADLHGRQVAILRGALSKLRPGGRLVYSTCSLEPEENEAVVQEAGCEVVPVMEELEALRREGTLILSDFEGLADGPFLRILPGRFGTDGFFAAVVAR